MPLAPADEAARPQPRFPEPRRAWLEPWQTAASGNPRRFAWVYVQKRLAGCSNMPRFNLLRVTFSGGGVFGTDRYHSRLGSCRCFRCISGIANAPCRIFSVTLALNFCRPARLRL